MLPLEITEKIKDEANLNKYSNSKILYFSDDKIPLLVFKTNSDIKAEYVLNLTTMRPTKNSRVQAQLSEDLIKEIKASMSLLNESN